MSAPSETDGNDFLGLLTEMVCAVSFKAIKLKFSDNIALPHYDQCLIYLQIIRPTCTYMYVKGLTISFAASNLFLISILYCISA